MELFIAFGAFVLVFMLGTRLNKIDSLSRSESKSIAANNRVIHHLGRLVLLWKTARCYPYMTIEEWKERMDKEFDEAEEALKEIGKEERK